MAKSTSIMLVAGGVSFANEWANTNTPNWRILAATLGSALVLDGIEQVSEPLAVSLSILAFIAVMATPLGGKAPADTVVSLLSTKGTQK